MQTQRPAPHGTPRPVRCIVKLGGSAVTVKHQHETLKAEVLGSVCSTLRQLYDTLQQQEQQPGFVVVHGAGSFGHFEASQYGITKPDTPQQTLLEGFAKTRLSVTRLNHLVVSALIQEGIPAVGVSPFGMCYSRNGSLHPDWQQQYVDAVQSALCSGLIPVLHGDGILEAAGPGGRYRDGHIAPAILSGDRIMLCLASQLQPQYAAFLTDVPGLLTAPPTQPDAQLIPRVWVQPASGELQYQLPQAAAAAVGQAGGGGGQQQHQQQGVQMTTAAHDTTGGMAAKVRAAADIAVAAAAPVIIAQAGTAAGAAAVLHGSSAGGSETSGSAAAAVEPIGTVVACVSHTS